MKTKCICVDDLDGKLTDPRCPVHGDWNAVVGSAITSASTEDQERIMAILENYAQHFPKWKAPFSGVEQDPLGVHALLERLRSWKP